MVRDNLARDGISLTLGRRLYRGLVFGLMVGLAASGLGAIPALFIQSIFVSEAQRCLEAIEQHQAGGDIVLTCPDEFADPPVWLPVLIIAGSASMGIAGGFGYGFLVTSSSRRPYGRVEQSWLPF